LKTYWWIRLILLVASSLLLIFGASAIGEFFLDCIGGIFGVSFFFLVWQYTFGRRRTQSWGVFRILGIIGVLYFTIILNTDSFDYRRKNLEVALDNSIFKFASLGLVFSLFLFVLGEIFLYLDNLQKSIKNNEAYNLSKENASNSMICPRCYGKGFVDLNDIKRLGMEQERGQGFCQYCEGKGEVEKGKTKILNPLKADIGPIFHKSDIKLKPAHNSV